MRQRRVGAAGFGAWGAFLVVACSVPEDPTSKDAGAGGTESGGAASGGVASGGTASGGTSSPGSGGSSGSNAGASGAGGAGGTSSGGTVSLPDASSGGESADACVPGGCGQCGSASEREGAPCGDCGHYVCSDAGLVCEGARFAPVVAVEAGGLFSCARLAGGRVRCWGENASGSLGDGTTTTHTSATTVDAAVHATSLSTGYTHACVLLESGVVQCWGSNASGELGDGSTTMRSRAVDVKGLAGPVLAIETGDSSSCVILKGTGAVQCWGDNRAGQLGDGTLVNATAPVTVNGITGATALAIGQGHDCALVAGGVVKCWGRNTFGALGDGTNEVRSAPVTVPLAGPAKAVSAGNDHTCALLETGVVQCWGKNQFGEVGNDTTGSYLASPVGVIGLAGVTQLSIGGFHSCVVLGDQTARCWGFNQYGGLGEDSTTNRATPVPVKEVGVKFLQLSAGGGRSHTCGIISGSPKCFGNNEHGQVGDDSYTDRWVPARVQGLGGICPE